MANCLNCKSSLNTGKRYCSRQCQMDYQRMSRVQKWLKGEISGMRGSTGTAPWIKWYLIRERGECCEKCGWSEKNLFTGNIPIELEHIDGNFKNNKIENLLLLCPNCHSLTKTYKGANLGNGRDRGGYYKKKQEEKKQKLIKNKKYYPKIKTKKIYFCSCGNIKSSKDANQCKGCSYLNQRKTERPPINILIQSIEKIGYTATGKKYGVSDNTVRKWIKK